MKNSRSWRWCVAGNLREDIPRRSDSLRPASAPPLKRVFIARDYDPASREVTVAWLNIKGNTAVIARVSLQILTSIRVMKTGLWWGSSLADMKNAEAYRDMLRAANGPHETAQEKTEY